jgi:hypothetical protein
LHDYLAAFILAGFAGWRLAYLLVYEEGPLGLVGRLRRALGVPVEGEIRGVLGNLLSCVLCLSFWTVLVMLGVYAVEPWAVVPLAAWGLAAALQRLAG